MTRPLSKDLRERLIEAVAQGATCRAAAARFGVAASTAVKLVRRWRDTGSSTPRPQGGDMRSERIEVHADEILEQIAKQIDITLVEIAAHLELTHGERFAPSTIWPKLARPTGIRGTCSPVKTIARKRCINASPAPPIEIMWRERAMKSTNKLR